MLTPNYGLLIEAAEGDDLMDTSHARLVELLKAREGGALLFRGFPVSSARFKEFTESHGENFVVHHNIAQRDYVEEDRTFATVNKGRAAIGFHNELSVSPYSPDAFWMHCEVPSRRLGKTGVVDGIAVLKSLTKLTRRFWAEQKFVIKKSYSKEAWTARWARPRAEVEQWLDTIGRRRGIVEFAFAPPPRETLTYTYAFPAIRASRLSGYEVFCCGLLDSPEQYLLDGGTPPPKSCVVEVTHAIYQNSYWIDWQVNDVLVVDNTRYMHSREAFDEDTRKLFVRYSDLKA
jgi:alpha-ketoglutarate-dependent taurine dioxygenase